MMAPGCAPPMCDGSAVSAIEGDRRDAHACLPQDPPPQSAKTHWGRCAPETSTSPHKATHLPANISYSALLALAALDAAPFSARGCIMCTVANECGRGPHATLDILGHTRQGDGAPSRRRADERASCNPTGAARPRHNDNWRSSQAPALTSSATSLLPPATLGPMAAKGCGFLSWLDRQCRCPDGLHGAHHPQCERGKWTQF